MTGIWWFVDVDDDMIRISHGRTKDGLPDVTVASVRTSLPAALELAVGIVHAALDIDAPRTQAAMLELWVRDRDADT